MMNYQIYLLRFLLLAVMAASGTGTADAQMPGPPISGVVFSEQRGPMGGVTISLVHPAVGRSSPALSAANGGYFFANVPPQAQPYFIEAYWGNQLLYRGQVRYEGGTVRFDIRLP